MADVAVFVQDLLFVSKIREAATRLGVSIGKARTPEDLAAAAQEARLVIVDLRLPDALAALDALAGDPVARAVPSVGFIDHEKVDVMEEARARGCGEVLAKGAFANRLPDLLPKRE